MKSLHHLPAEERIARFSYYSLILFCIYLAATRALAMPIQGDEAGTYLRHATQGLGGIFTLGTANNHFLNTFFVWLSTLNAPFSEPAIRLPTIIVFVWLYFIYIPSRSCFRGWAEKLLFSALSLFPYYISEYASMARGYMMSTCFAYASLNELALFTWGGGGAGNDGLASENETAWDKEINKATNTIFYASLATLSSIVTIPLFAATIVPSLIYARGMPASPLGARRGSDLIRLKLSLSLAIGTLILTAYTFYSIKSSGVSTIVAGSIPFHLWILGTPSIITAPIESIANTIPPNSPGFSAAISISLACSFILATFTQLFKKSLRISIIALLASLVFVYSLKLFGSYPIGRAWIPYWFPITFAATGVLSTISNLKSLSYQIAHASKSFLLMAAMLFSIATLSQLFINFETRYVNEFRPFYYQYKSLMHYSRSQNLQCLSYGDINDEVLKFYFLNPNGPVPQPEECKQGRDSQYGFMPYSMNNREPFFERH